MEAVCAAWNAPVSATDPCRVLDQKLRMTARALRSWRATRVGAIRLQLAAARTIIYEFDTAQESRQLTAEELQLQSEMKQSVLGLSSLCQTMA
jgi:hypothetical protein